MVLCNGRSDSVTVQTNARFGMSNDDEIQLCNFIILNVPLHKVALGVLSQKKWMQNLFSFGSYTQICTPISPSLAQDELWLQKKKEKSWDPYIIAYQNAQDFKGNPNLAFDFLAGGPYSNVPKKTAQKSCFLPFLPPKPYLNFT